MKRKKSRDTAAVSLERSSGNVFADLGLPNAEDLLVKADLAGAINVRFEENGWTQMQAAERSGLTQSEVSRLAQMRIEGFSQQRMVTVLRRLGLDVEIRIHRRKNGGIGTLKVREIA
jgi:predicted XRE-type DNA-binding protein